MLFRSLLSAAASSALLVALHATVAQAAGSMKLAPATAAPLTIEYTTDKPHDKNWIGLYNYAGGGPVDQKKDEESIVWKYAPGSSGKVHLPTPDLASARYKLFFLAQDGYQWITPPIDYTKTGGLQVVDDDPITVSFTTVSHDPRNWLGIWRASGGGPVKEAKDQASLDWVYTNGTVEKGTLDGKPWVKGTYRFKTGGLEPGKYKMFYLARDGYKWVAEPVDVSVNGRVRRVEGEPLTFEYSTISPSSTNWVGLYKTGEGPSHGKQNGDKKAVAWKYAPSSSGRVALDTQDLQAGTYQVYFLASDGYRWLGEWIEIAYSPPFRFYLDSATLHNARVGNAFSYKASGLFDGDVSGVSFSKASGSAWLSVSSAGALSGTPPAGTADSSIVMRATKGAFSATITLQVPVRAAGSPLVANLRVMTYNMWLGGTNVNNHHGKQVRFFAGSDLDIVAFQETQNGADAKRVADALGWHSWTNHRTVAVVSRYPIETVHGPALSHAGGVRVVLGDGGPRINVWAAHLGFEPYGPYDFCFDKMSVARVLEREAQSGRAGQITDTLAAMKGQIAQADDTPVLLLGDFNAPSHLDYTEALRSKNCGYANVPWPTSVKPTEAGLRDSFRVVNPDPASKQGLTWSPIVKTNSGRLEPQDRIDFVYFKGKKLGVLSSQTVVVGSPKEKGSHQDNEWTTDHAAVVTEFSLDT